MNHTPEPAFRNLDHISSNAQDTSKLAALSARIAELEAENKSLRILASGGIDLFERYSTFKAKCAELEAMLDAVGAGGVGQSIKPQVQADTAPAAWAVYSDDGTAIRLWSRDKKSAQEAADKLGLPLVALYAAPQPTENLKCKSTQKRLATLWGYEKARQPLTDSQVKELAKKHSAEDLCRWSYGMGIKDAEAAHGITGGQQ